MNIILTGANGFIGRVLAQRLLSLNPTSLTLLDLAMDAAPDHPAVRVVTGALQETAVLDQAFANGCDLLLHLAAVPGGAAEQNPALSRAVNLDGTLALFERATANGNTPRIVYASTIAVLGAPLPATVDDNCPVAPAMTYGCHKAMIELALADLHRRGVAEAVSFRLPGIVARPPGPSGLKSAFMSNIFHALKAGDAFVCPVSSTATMWMMSVRQVVENFIHAAQLDPGLMPASRVVTLPALTVSMGDLVAALCASTGSSPALVSYAPDADLEAHFGAYPPLQAARAEQAGFRHDGSVCELVDNALENC